MTQELIDLRNSILERRYEDALAIVDELEGMSKQAILRNIESLSVKESKHENYTEKSRFLVMVDWICLLRFFVSASQSTKYT